MLAITPSSAKRSTSAGSTRSMCAIWWRASGSRSDGLDGVEALAHGAVADGVQVQVEALGDEGAAITA